MAVEATSPLPPPVGDILETIGRTPVVRLRRIAGPDHAALYAKLEQFNPSGTVEDRLAPDAIRRAEAEGRLRPGATIVAAPGLNGGIALAQACATKGYSLVVVMPDDMPPEHRLLLKSFHTRLELSEAAQGDKGAVHKAEQIAAEHGTFLLRIDLLGDAAAVHARTTGRELLDAIDADGTGIHAFVAGMGPGWTLDGVGRALRVRFPSIVLVAVEPAAGSRHLLSAMGPPPDDTLAGRRIAIDDETAWASCARLAREEGILAGMVSGAALVAALSVAAELGPGRNVYTLFPDAGERSLALARHFA